MNRWSKIKPLGSLALAAAAFLRAPLAPATAASPPGAVFPHLPMGAEAIVTCEPKAEFNGRLIGLNAEWVVLSGAHRTPYEEIWIPRKSVAVMGLRR